MKPLEMLAEVDRLVSAPGIREFYAQLKPDPLAEAFDQFMQVPVAKGPAFDSALLIYLGKVRKLSKLYREMSSVTEVVEPHWMNEDSRKYTQSLEREKIACDTCGHTLDDRKYLLLFEHYEPAIDPKKVLDAFYIRSRCDVCHQEQKQKKTSEKDPRESLARKQTA